MVQEQKWKEYLRSREEIASKRKQWPTLSNITDQIRSDQSLSRVQLFVTPSLCITNSRSSLRLTSIESVMPSKEGKQVPISFDS